MTTGTATATIHGEGNQPSNTTMLPTVGVLTYNCYWGDEFREKRVPHIAQEIVKNRPDIVCLQESTPAVVKAVQKLCAEAGESEKYNLKLVWSKTKAALALAA